MWVSPNYQDTDFSWPLSLDGKIAIFLDRTYGWQLDIAEQCINGRQDSEGKCVLKPIPHSGFAVLNIILSYFEMIAKYQDGFTKNSKSEYYFKQGLYSVFPQLKNESTMLVDNLLDVLYFGCRCGLYHAGMTDQNIVLSGDTLFPLVYVPHELKLKINPHLLVPSLKAHLADYGKQLRETTNAGLRQKFEKRFDFDALKHLTPGSSKTRLLSVPPLKNSTKRSCLPDILKNNPKVVFCSITTDNPSRLDTYYSDYRNRFWVVLFRIGLIPRTLSPGELHALPKYGIGLTKLVLNKKNRHTHQSLPGYDIKEFRTKIERLSPLTVAFNGKRAAQEVYGYSVHYGRQPEPIGSSTVFVLPSTSGIACKYWNELYWRELAEFVKSHSQLKEHSCQK